ncbi:MAG: transposase [Xenococcus sp. (in: cyanobacteria)]
MSLVSVQQEKAFPIRLEQQFPTAPKPKALVGKNKLKRKVGRPKGSTNKDKTQVNLVIILKTNLKTQQQVHVILFSSDLSLDAQTLIKYYSLRFQIEFNFRDAKQFWSLEDFMNTSATGVINRANLSFFMVNFSFRLLQHIKLTAPDSSLLDLKALSRGQIYVTEILKYLPQIPNPILLQSIFTNVSNLGAIHPITSSNPTL